MTESQTLLIDHVETAIGRLAIVANRSGQLCAVGWTDGHSRMERHLRGHSSGRAATLIPTSNPAGLTTALGAYFAGDLRAIVGLPVALAGGTEFQLRVWRALLEIPCGETRSYAKLAQRIGNPAAVRAVGLANGANPIGIVVPCHRVIGANGSLTGYGGGIERKRWLLEHEGLAGAGLKFTSGPSTVQGRLRLSRP
jgi:methylated-DNA-[protein]-cysteine S-methyltransferase